MSLLCRLLGHSRHNDAAEQHGGLNLRENPCLRCGDPERPPIPIRPVNPPPGVPFVPPHIDD